MRHAVICFPAVLILCLMGFVVSARPDSDFCPDNPTGTSIKTLPSGTDAIPPSTKSYTVPRRQALVEIATATW
ncbi:MAG: hypothetical protein WCE90_03820 [Candidatus Zixiibacteriota bacterium]